jgi:hypothetical protein
VPILQVEHAVRDYDVWKQAFDGDPIGREAGGVRHHRIVRANDDPNRVMIELEFDTTDEAERFRTKLEEMWVDAGPRLGLESPSAQIVDVAEQKSY